MQGEMDLFCKIFVNVNTDIDKLVELIAEILHGTPEKWSIINEACTIGVVENDEYDVIKSQDGTEGFLFSKFYLDIEPTLVEVSTYMSQIGFLLEGLWAAGLKAVASCDFEEYLPKRGGYSHSG